MKKINLRVGREEINGKSTFFTTYDILKMAINYPEERGFNVEEMAYRLKLLEKIEKYKDKFFIKENEFTEDKLLLEDVLELEDSEFEKLKKLFASLKWTVLSKFVVDLDKELKKTN